MYTLIVKHIENEDAGTIIDYLDARGAAYKKVRLYAGESLPVRLDDISSVIVLGGPMNVYEQEKYPHLKDEDVFIKSVLAHKIPFFGICLGAQLLAKACGAKIYKAANSEIGVHDVQLSDVADVKELAIFAAAPHRFQVVQWHGDTFDLPGGARLLVTSDLCRHQAFVINENAYGLQFHVEVNEELVRDWFKDNLKGDDIVNAFIAMKKEYDLIARGIYDRFFMGMLPNTI